MGDSTLNNNRMSLFSLTWPIFIEIFLQMLLGNADTLMLSQYSDNAVAAVGVSNQILSMIVIMYGILAAGTAILVSQYLGAEKRDKVIEVTAVAIGVNLVFGLMLSLVLFLFKSYILKLMNLPEELMDNAISYMSIVGGFSFIQALIMTIISIVRSHGLMKVSMYVTIGTNIINVIGNYLFIFGPFGIPVLGVTGVAISTTISRAIGLAVMFTVLNRRLDGQLSLKVLKPFPRDTLGKLLKIGVPTAGEQLSYNTSQIAITYFVSMLGTEALTTRVYAQNIMMFIYLFAVAIGQGTQILVGHLIGGDHKKQAYNTCLSSLKKAALASLFMASIFAIFRNSLLGIFTDNPNIIKLGTPLILMTVILEPGRTFNLVIINSLRGAGDVRFPVYMGILSMWGVSVSLSYILGIHFGLGLLGMWIAFAADEWLRGLLMLWRWRSRAWEGKAFVTRDSE